MKKLNEELKEGWCHLINSTKWHYFVDHRSLCGRWLCLSLSGLEQGNDNSSENCNACRIKLTKLKEKREKNVK